MAEKSNYPFRPHKTPELQTELEEFYRHECEHAVTLVVKSVVKNGAVQIRRQCQNCGALQGNPLPKQSAPGDLPLFNSNLYVKFAQEREDQKEAIFQKHIRLQDGKRSNFDKQYAEYLKSSVWKEKRRKVLDRAGGICEGCGVNKANQVHHLTYEHVFQEMLFELVAICDTCHMVCHPDVYEDESPCAACRYQSAADDGQDWCARFDETMKTALASGGLCGPSKDGFEPLK